MKCPNCKHVQEGTIECESCGIVFADFYAQLVKKKFNLAIQKYHDRELAAALQIFKAIVGAKIPKDKEIITECNKFISLIEGDSIQMAPGLEDESPSDNQNTTQEPFIATDAKPNNQQTTVTDTGQRKLSMWKYSIGGACAALALQMVFILVFKTFGIVTSGFQALLVAFGTRVWCERSEPRFMNTGERKQLLLQYAILVGFIFILVGKVWSMQNQVTLFGIVVLLISWGFYPVFLYRYTNANYESKYFLSLKRLPPHLRRVSRIIAVQAALSLLIALAAPADILSHAWAFNWANSTLGALAPHMMKVPAASSCPQVAVFYNATMLVICPIFMLLGFVVIILEPKPYREKLKYDPAQICSKSSLILSSIILLAIIAIYLKIWLWNPQTLRYKISPYGVILWGSRITLAVGGTCFWVGPTGLAVLLGLERFIFKSTWNYIPWFRAKV